MCRGSRVKGHGITRWQSPAAAAQNTSKKDVVHGMDASYPYPKGPRSQIIGF